MSEIVGSIVVGKKEVIGLPQGGKDMKKLERVLLICGHPDDEVIGMGGTIRKLVNAGVEVSVLIFANGNEGYVTMEEKDTIVDRRRKERAIVQDILGITNYEAYDYGDYEIPKNAATYKLCIQAIRKYKPDIVFSHYWMEYMPHKAVATLATEAWWQAGWDCSMDLGNPWKAGSFYHFEVIRMLTEVSHIVDISDTFEAKIEAMRAYASQIDVVGGALQRIEGIAKLRGADIGVSYGEAFLQANTAPQAITNLQELC